MTLSEDQKKAFKEILTWLMKKNKPFWRLTGFAGCGKTVLIKEIISNVEGLSVIVATLAWKAALVLKDKGIDSAQSIHSAFYKLENPEAIKPNFILKTYSELSLNADYPFQLIIIDEASMVNSKLRKDILSFGVPVLFVGDNEQLPCIPDENSAEPEEDFLLESESKLHEIHRQALNSPIIRLSMDIRNDKFIKYGKYGNGVFKLHPNEVTDKLLLASDQIICGKNITRQNLNNRIRELKGIDPKSNPKAGEKIIFFKNYHELGFFNGSMYYVANDCEGELINSSNEILTITTPIITDLGVLEATANIKPYFKNITKLPYEIENTQDPKVKFGRTVRYLKEKNLKEIDFGYAVTAHKFQGSQAPKVLVYFEYMQGMDKIMKRRWLYTAVTRAEEKLILVM